jgi:hypothetical protein
MMSGMVYSNWQPDMIVETASLTRSPAAYRSGTLFVMVGVMVEEVLG